MGVGSATGVFVVGFCGAFVVGFGGVAEVEGICA
jgi:hypothetical protein